MAAFYPPRVFTAAECELFREWWSAGVTGKEMASRFGCSVSAVWRMSQKLDLPNRIKANPAVRVKLESQRVASTKRRLAREERQRSSEIESDRRVDLYLLAIGLTLHEILERSCESESWVREELDSLCRPRRVEGRIYPPVLRLVDGVYRRRSDGDTNRTRAANATVPSSVVRGYTIGGHRCGQRSYSSEA